MQLSRVLKVSDLQRFPQVFWHLQNEILASCLFYANCNIGLTFDINSFVFSYGFSSSFFSSIVMKLSITFTLHCPVDYRQTVLKWVRFLYCHRSHLHTMTSRAKPEVVATVAAADSFSAFCLLSLTVQRRQRHLVPRPITTFVGHRRRNPICPATIIGRTVRPSVDRLASTCCGPHANLYQRSMCILAADCLPWVVSCTDGATGAQRNAKEKQRRR